MYTRKCEVYGSNNIEGIDYDFDEKKMMVFFATGDVYEYFNIPPGLFGQLISSESVGKMFQLNVRNNSAIKFERIVS